MKKLFKAAWLFMIIIILSSCDKDEGKLPNLEFKSGGDYLTSSVTKPGKSIIHIGIDASKAEKKDVLKKFNLSKSVNGATEFTVDEKSLSGSEADNFSYDYTATLDSIHGQTNRYIFTITNRDGLVNQKELTVTVQ